MSWNYYMVEFFYENNIPSYEEVSAISAQEFNEVLEKIRDFTMMNRLQISWSILGIFVFASIQSLLVGNFVNSALFLLAAMMVVF